MQDNFKIRFSQDANGRTTVFSMTQDIIDESRKAFDTSATSATGYGSNGPPSGRYLAPAGGNGCFYLYIGDCGEQEYYFHLPLFSRFDMTFKKNFPLGGEALVRAAGRHPERVRQRQLQPQLQPGWKLAGHERVHRRRTARSIRAVVSVSSCSA